jgi:Terminase large subunit, T4likevirus-type, N-terminal
MDRAERDNAANAVKYTAIWKPQPQQARFISCPLHEVFFGGARGGGKSDAILGEWVAHATRYGENAIGIVVRRELTQLLELIERSRTLYTPIGASYHDRDKVWHFPNGARLRFAYLERDADADNYIGSSFTRVYVEEIGTFPSPKPIFKLMSCLRSGAGVPVGFRATGNPGGAGAHWVKARYVSPAPLGNQVITDPDTGLKRIFIPSKVRDNQYLDQDKYVAQLRMSGSEQLVKAWLDGDWSQVENAFFSEWEDATHIIEPFKIPHEWTHFRSCDWGFAVPFSVNWFTVVGDDFEHMGRIIPRGTLINYREWYGTNGQPNVGLRLTAEEVAAGIKAREMGERIGHSVIDPSAFAESGGPSIAERLAVAGVLFMRADNKRLSSIGSLGGWDQMRQRLKTGRLLFFSNCAHTIRCIPLMQHDPDRPEDADSEGEDHAPDSVRYACMSRPWIRKVPEAKDERPRYAGDGRFTVDDLIALHERQSVRIRV